jgi:2-methylcitrate dehydratase PrpD
MMPSRDGAASCSEKLASFAINVRFEDFSPAEIALIKERILDQIGCQLMASTLSSNRPFYDYVSEMGAAGRCTVAGKDRRLAPTDAAFINATFGQGCEMDDFGHAGAATVPAAFALLEHRGGSGRDLIASIGVGYEVQMRLFNALMPELADRGFHIQCVAGVFTAASIAGRLLSLRTEQLAHAFGIAASHASGTLEYDQTGGAVKRMHAGLGARGGLQAGFLAERGLQAPRTIFESPRGGVLHTFVEAGRLESIERELGSRFTFPETVITKFWPTLGALHTSIDAFGQLVDRHGFAAEQVRRIRVGLQAHAIRHGASIVVPQDELGAQFSLAYSLALRIVHGRNDLDLYTDPAVWRDPKVAVLARRVEAYVDPEAVGECRHGSRITVELTSGEICEAYQPHRKGSRGNPASRDDLLVKYRTLAERVLGCSRTAEIANLVDRLEHIADAAELPQLLRVTETTSIAKRPRSIDSTGPNSIV